jgi:hypothetical protein
MSFFVSSKTFLFGVIDLTWVSIQLVGSTIRYAWIVATQTLKASWRMKRPTSIGSYVSAKEKETAEIEERGLNHSIAHISAGWAYIEIMFDYTNLYIINTFATDETQLPVSLKPKIAFYKKHFRTIPKLHNYQIRASEIVDWANRLKVARHDVVHGLAVREAPAGFRRYLRHDYRGKRLVKQTKEYSYDDVSKISLEMFALGRSMAALLREIGGTNLRSFFENPEG